MADPTTTTGKTADSSTVSSRCASPTPGTTPGNTRQVSTPKPESRPDVVGSFLSRHMFSPNVSPASSHPEDSPSMSALSPSATGLSNGLGEPVPLKLRATGDEMVPLEYTVVPSVKPSVLRERPGTAPPETALAAPSYKGGPTVQRQHKNYCYRHHPDITCNRQADAKKMRELQEEMEKLDERDQEAINHVWSIFSAAPSQIRTLMLQGIMAQCCFPQLSAVSQLVKDLIRIDYLSALPIELAFKVLCYLDSASLCKAALVSRHWRKLADDDVVWHRMCEQHIDKKCTKCGWGLPLLEKKRLREAKRAIELRATSGHPVTEVSDSEDASGSKRSLEIDTVTSDGQGRLTKKRRTRPWKDVYSERYKIERNWRTGKYQLRQFKDTSAVLCLQFDEQYLMTGTYDGKIKVWDIETGELLRTLSGHLQAVSCLKFDQSKLISGSWDRTVRIWNYRTGECISTFTGHSEQVLCIDFHEKWIASGSADNNIKVWNFEKLSCFTLRGHREWVHSVKIHGPSGTLYSASEDMTVRMWDLSTQKCIRVFGGLDNSRLGYEVHVAQVQQVIPLTLDHLEGEAEPGERDFVRVTKAGGSPVATTADTTTETGGGVETLVPNGSRELANIDGTDNTVWPWPVKDKCLPTHLLTSSLDNTIKLWDISTGKVVRTLFGHVEGVWGIAADTFRIVSGGHDRLVKVWDLQSGGCWHTFSGHTRPVCCVGLSDTRFASGGDDGIVNMYCFDDFSAEDARDE